MKNSLNNETGSFVHEGGRLKTSSDLEEQKEFLQAEVAVLKSVGQRIASRLGHHDSIKILHRDQNGVFACAVSEKSCKGTFSSSDEVSDSAILANL